MDKDRMNILYQKPGNIKDAQKESAEWVRTLIGESVLNTCR